MSLHISGLQKRGIKVMILEEIERMLFYGGYQTEAHYCALVWFRDRLKEKLI